MAVALRLSRGGSKKRPFFRIVAADVRAPRDGRYLERLGTYLREFHIRYGATACLSPPASPFLLGQC